MNTPSGDVAALLAETFDSDPEVRRRAIAGLCPCHVKRHHAQVWERVFALADDADRDVRNWVLHVLTDGSPRSRADDVARVLERMQHDADPKLRRKARQVLAHYRRTGVLNVS